MTYCICGHPEVHHTQGPFPRGLNDAKVMGCWCFRATGEHIPDTNVKSDLKCPCYEFVMDNLSTIEALAIERGLV